MCVCVCVCVYQIKIANNAVGDLVFFCKSSDVAEWSCFFF